MFCGSKGNQWQHPPFWKDPSKVRHPFSRCIWVGQSWDGFGKLVRILAIPFRDPCVGRPGFNRPLRLVFRVGGSDDLKPFILLGGGLLRHYSPSFVGEDLPPSFFWGVETNTVMFDFVNFVLHFSRATPGLPHQKRCVWVLLVGPGGNHMLPKVSPGMPQGFAGAARMAR